MIRLNVNRKEHVVDVDPDTPLLWVLREDLPHVAAGAPCVSGHQLGRSLPSRWAR